MAIFGIIFSVINRRKVIVINFFFHRTGHSALLPWNDENWAFVVCLRFDFSLLSSACLTRSASSSICILIVFIAFGENTVHSFLEIGLK
jgi:hypothetical protein